MKKLLNTLYITSQKTYLAKERETVAIHLENRNKVRIPFHTLDGIVCFGNIRLSPYLIGACGDYGISISYLSKYGHFLGRFCGKTSGNVILRRQQYRIADSDENSTIVAKNVVIGKVGNANTVIKRFLRDYPGAETNTRLIEISNRLKSTLKLLKKANTTGEVRGLEGEAAANYFSIFDNLITKQKEDFRFKERSRRPPLNETNALLSFIYTLLYHDLTSACETVGLDPSVGFLHKDRPGRNSLALDLAEEFRSFLADRLVISLINRKQITKNDFFNHANGAVYLKEKSRKIVLEAYQKRKKVQITHPFLGDKMPIGILFYFQALLLCRYIRGDIESYPPFLWS